MDQQIVGASRSMELLLSPVFCYSAGALQSHRPEGPGQQFFWFDHST